MPHVFELVDGADGKHLRCIICGEKTPPPACVHAHVLRLPPFHIGSMGDQTLDLRQCNACKCIGIVDQLGQVHWAGGAR